MANKTFSSFKVFILSLCFSVFKLISQPFPAYTSPPINLSGTASSGNATIFYQNITLNPFGISNGANFEFKARHYIDFKPGSYASNLDIGNGSVHAHIEPPPFEVVSYHMNGFNGIPIYDKFELGIKLPEDLTNNINSFFGTTLRD
jgi:hypothetical protein